MSMFPVVACLGSYVFLGEKLHSLHILAVILCISGAVLISEPTFLFGGGDGVETNSIGYLTAAGGAIGGGLVFILMRVAAAADTLQLMFSHGVHSTLFGLVLGNTLQKFVWPTPEMFLYITLGTVTAVIGQYCVIYGGTHAPAGPGSVISTVDVLWGYLFEIF